MATILWLVIFGFHLPGSLQESKIDATLSAKLSTDKRADVMVTLVPEIREKLLKKVRSIRPSEYASFGYGGHGPERVTRTHVLYDWLHDGGLHGQDTVLHILMARRDQFSTYVCVWTSTRIFVRNATTSLIEYIADDRNVSKVELEPTFRIPKMEDCREKRDVPPSGEAGWNINITQVPEAWAALNSKGEGVVVGVIDTGVAYMHPKLKGRWREKYGWYVPKYHSFQDDHYSTGEPEPYPDDQDGHGTGVTGVIVGVAPGVQVMVCQACVLSEMCRASDLSACLAYMACPSLYDGTKRSCGEAPRVITVSVTDVQATQFLKEDLETIREAGVIPVFGVGNRGPRCSTVESLSALDLVIGVGATDDRDRVWPDSAVGPTADGRVKPDLVAPGEEVWTTWGDKPEGEGVAKFSGTGFASAHVAGVIALLLVRQPELTFEEAYKLLTENAQREGLGVPSLKYSRACKQEMVDKVPNNHFGWGRVNALRAIEAQTKLLAAKTT